MVLHVDALEGGALLGFSTGCFVKPGEPSGGGFLHGVANNASGIQLPIKAAHAGDAVLIHVSCDTALGEPTVTVTSNGWTWVQATSTNGVFTGIASHAVWAVAFGALAPDTNQETLNVSSSLECDRIVEVGDEITTTSTDLMSVFDVGDATTGMSGFTDTIDLQNADDTIWAACTAPTTSLDPGPTFNAGSSASDSLAEHRLTQDGPGTIETIAFTPQTTLPSPFVITVVTVRTR